MNPQSAERERLVALRSSGLCDGVHEVSAEELAAHCRLVRYGPEPQLFRERVPASGAHVVTLGRVKLRRLLGGREVILRIHHAGALLGLAAAANGRSHAADAVTLEPGELLFIPAAALREWMEADVRAALAVTARLAWEVQECHRLVALRDGDLLTRVSAALLEYAVGCQVDLDLEMLGALVGTDATGACRILRQLRRVKAVRRWDDRIEVLDSERLRSYTERDLR